VIAGAQSCFPLLAAELSAALPCAPARTSARATSPVKTRVGGSRCNSSGRLSRRARRRPINTPGLRGCDYKTASGRHEWLNRDPIWELGFDWQLHASGVLSTRPIVAPGGLNLYRFCRNEPIGHRDALGLYVDQACTDMCDRDAANRQKKIDRTALCAGLITGGIGAAVGTVASGGDPVVGVGVGAVVGGRW